jgi:hypothetical protein
LRCWWVQPAGRARPNLLFTVPGPPNCRARSCNREIASHRLFINRKQFYQLEEPRSASRRVTQLDVGGHCARAPPDIAPRNRAGNAPAERINLRAITALAENGIDISAYKPEHLITDIASTKVPPEYTRNFTPSHVLSFRHSSNCAAPTSSSSISNLPSPRLPRWAVCGRAHETCPFI